VGRAGIGTIGVSAVWSVVVARGTLGRVGLATVGVAAVWSVLATVAWEK
jgi:hypothetical protein